MSHKKPKTVQFDKEIDNVEEQYIRSGGKDPYVLTMLTRAYGEGKKAKDETGKRNLAKGYESMKQAIIRKYNDVELENVKLQYELLSIQNQLKSQVATTTASPEKVTSPQAEKNPILPTVTQPISIAHLPLVHTNPVPNYATYGMPSVSQGNITRGQLPFTGGMPFGMPFGGLPTKFPFGNTYIVTGDEVYINGADVDVGNKSARSSTSFKNLNYASKREKALKEARKLSAPSVQHNPINNPTPVVGLDADYDSIEDIDYNDEPFFEVNRAVPQGPYDFNSGIILFFDFATKLPKEARYCRLSIALITAGKMKPPISFTALPTEQFSPGDHPEFKHFTTVCRFAYSLAVSGGRPNGNSKRSGIQLIAEIMISPDKPADDQAPVLGWIRHGWVSISATRKTFEDDSHLTTYAGRYRTMLKKSLPLSRGTDGLLELDDSQPSVDHRTELFYRIVNAQQCFPERLAPVDIKYMEYYDQF